MTIRLPMMNKTFVLKKREANLGRETERKTLMVSHSGGYQNGLEQNKLHVNAASKQTMNLFRSCCFLCLLMI
ncbi:hypothetical protein LguiB_023004 [Lonicera macranthoides]